MVMRDTESYLFYSNDAPRLTLTNVIARSLCFLIHFNRNKLEQNDFSIDVEAKVSLRTRYGSPNETIAMDKHLRSRLNFWPKLQI